jgi:ribonucleoside-diphosphate reductase alpha chain
MAAASWTDNALTVLERRYLRKDPTGRPIERPSELLPRVARALAAPDAAYGDDPAAAERDFLGALESLELFP